MSTLVMLTTLLRAYWSRDNVKCDDGQRQISHRESGVRLGSIWNNFGRSRLSASCLFTLSVHIIDRRLHRSVPSIRVRSHIRQLGAGGNSICRRSFQTILFPGCWLTSAECAGNADVLLLRDCKRRYIQPKTWKAFHMNSTQQHKRRYSG